MTPSLKAVKLTIIHEKLAEKNHWRVGDKITLSSLTDRLVQAEFTIMGAILFPDRAAPIDLGRRSRLISAGQFLPSPPTTLQDQTGLRPPGSLASLSCKPDARSLPDRKSVV